MTAYDDYILQSFPDEDGNLETNKPKQCRICWFQNGYPPFNELAEICNSTEKTIRTYSSRFNWKSIRAKAEDIKSEVELEEQKKRQDEAIKTLDEKNNKRLQILDTQLEEIDNLLASDTLSDLERSELRKEQRDIIKEYHLVQNDKLRTVNLPDKLNDKQEHQHKGVVDLDLHLKAFLG